MLRVPLLASLWALRYLETFIRKRLTDRPRLFEDNSPITLKLFLKNTDFDPIDRQFTTVTEADESELNFGKTSEFQYGTTKTPETFRVKLLSEKLSKNDVKLEQISGPFEKPTFLTYSEGTTEPSLTEPKSRTSQDVEIITSSILAESITNSTDEITPWHASKSPIF